MPVMFSFYRVIRCIISAVLRGSLLVIVVACMSFAFCQMINKEIIYFYFIYRKNSKIATTFKLLASAVDRAGAVHRRHLHIGVMMNGRERNSDEHCMLFVTHHIRTTA